jgi:hypothetical protein
MAEPSHCAVVEEE